MGVAGDGRRRCGLLRRNQDFRGSRMDVGMDNNTGFHHGFRLDSLGVYNSSSSSEATHYFVHGLL